MEMTVINNQQITSLESSLESTINFSVSSAVA